tara:strand:+ start:611 stop:1099 length:489 start_codon:yes stop_codon:yes gene_type:complete
MKKTKAKIEALLHCNSDGYSLNELAKHTEVASKGFLKNALIRLSKEYENRSGGLRIVDENGIWKMQVHDSHLNAVQDAARPEINKAVLETLAYIAHKHPIRQADVVRIRSNKAYRHIKELVEEGFLEAKKDGSSKKLNPTRKFYDYFNLPEGEAFEIIEEEE